MCNLIEPRSVLVNLHNLVHRPRLRNVRAADIWTQLPITLKSIDNCLDILLTMFLEETVSSKRK